MTVREEDGSLFAKSNQSKWTQTQTQFNLIERQDQKTQTQTQINWTSWAGDG